MSNALHPKTGLIIKNLFTILWLCFLLAGCTKNTAVQSAYTEQLRKDGDWWRTLRDHEKPVFITGFFYGMELGGKFSYWGILDADRNDDAYEKAITSYKLYALRYIKNKTWTEIIDGVDVFYEDFRNRKIKITGAVWLVLVNLSGEPPEKMEKIIENWRKSAEKE